MFNIESELCPTETLTSASVDEALGVVGHLISREQLESMILGEYAEYEGYNLTRVSLINSTTKDNRLES